MAFAASTAQLEMLEGRILNRTPRAGVFNYKSPWGAGSLYVFVESRGVTSEFVCRVVVETIGREFKTSNRSLTASLTSAIKAAHRELLSENRRSLRDHRVTVGVTCVVVRDGEIFFAQAGPAVAYALLGDDIRRIPAASSRALPSWSTPLGGGDTIEVSLSHWEVGPGDVVLLASSLLATRPVESELPDLLPRGPEEVLRQLEVFLRHEEAFSALAIGFGSASPRGASVSSPPAGEVTPRRERSTPGAAIVPAVIGLAAAVLSRVRFPSWRKKRAGDARRTSMPANSEKIAKRSARPSGNGHDRKAVSVLARQTSERKSPSKPVEENTLGIVWSKSAGTVEDRYKGVLPPPKRSRARFLRLPLFLLVVVLAGLIVSSLITNFGRFADNQSAATYDRAMSSAAVTRERAAKAGDLAQSRSLLNDADHLVDEAMSIKKDDPKAKALKLKISADLAKLNAVVTLPEPKMLTDLSKVEGGAKNVTSLVIDGDNAFILDRGASRVYQFGIDLANDTLKVGKSTLIVKKGDRVGDVTVSDLVNILWMSAGGARQTSNLLIFDSARNLFEYTPGKGMAVLKVRGTQAWINPALALGYNSNLYILDPSASQVWRYFPTFNGYDSEMRGLLENADIKDAVDFAIDKDIFVMTRGGRVLKFVGGRLESFNQDQLDKGLSTPTSIFTTPKTKYVYAVDTGNNRIVVFTKDGKFQRQLVGAALDASPRSIHVDEERGKIYVLGDNKLYLSRVP